MLDVKDVAHLARLLHLTGRTAAAIADASILGPAFDSTKGRAMARLIDAAAVELDHHCREALLSRDKIELS